MAVDGKHSLNWGKTTCVRGRGDDNHNLPTRKYDDPVGQRTWKNQWNLEIKGLGIKIGWLKTLRSLRKKK